MLRSAAVWNDRLEIWSARSSGSGSRPQASLNAGIFAKTIQIIGVFIAARDREDARADHVGQRKGNPRWIATVGKTARQSLGDAKAPLGHRQQHNAAIRGEASAIESTCDLLARNGWKRERQEIIVGHGERAARERVRKGILLWQ